MVVAVPGGVATQPTNRVVWPHERAAGWGLPPATSGMFVWDVESALKIPSVSRASALYTGLIRQCAMDAYRGTTPLDRPRILDRPDPDRSRAWFVGVQVEDYLWHGNALSLVLDRNAEGWPSAVAWIPAAWTAITQSPGEGPRYWISGKEVPADRVIHVRRSADRWAPARGIGVIEQHLGTLARVGLEDDYERNALSGSGVPSVAVIAPNPVLSQGEADEAKASWMDKFYGPVREPVILPYGTQITPLGWSPADSQMIEARKMSLLDVANAFNLDGYWLGAPAASLTYRSPGPMYATTLRTSLEPVLADFEQEWSNAWLPRGQTVRFDRLQLTREDWGNAAQPLAALTSPPQVAPELGPIISKAEAREYLGLPATAPGLTVVSPIDTEPEPEPIPAPELEPEEEPA